VCTMTISAEGLSTVINNISDAVFIHDKAGNILFVNDKMAELYCINKEQAKRLSIAKDLSGNDAAVNTLPDIWDKVLTNGTCDISFEWQAKRPNDGSCFDVHVRLFKISYQSIDAVLALVSDISGMKKSELMLRESEERYRLAIECSNDGVAIVKGTDHLYVNHKFAEMFGYESPDDIIGKDHSITVHPDDLDTVVDYNRRRHNGEQVPSRYEFRGIRKDGSIMYVSASVNNMVYQGDNVSIAYLRDITPQIKQEAILHMQRDLAMLLARATSVEDAIAGTLNSVLNVTTMDAGCIYLLNSASGDFELRYHVGLSENFIEEISVIKNGSAEMSRLKHLNYDTVFSCHEPTIDNVFAAATMKEGFTLIARVPLVYAGTLKGLMCVGTHGKGSLLPDSNEENMLKAAAAQLVTLINKFEIERELNYSNKQIKRMLGNAMIGMFRVTLDGRLLAVNKALANMYGYADENDFIRGVKGTSLGTYAVPEERQAFIDTLLANGAVVGFEKRAKHKDGHVMWIRISARVVEEDGMEYIEGMSEDITSQKLAEEELERQVQILSSVLDNVPDIIGIQKPDHTIIRYNKAGYDMLGISHNDVADKRCYELIGRNMPCDVCMTAKAVKSKKLEQTEKYVPELGRYLFCRSNPVLNKNGDVVLLVEQLQDITDRIHADKELLMLSEAIEASMDGIAVLDRNDRYVYVNRAHAEIYGYGSASELIGKTWRMLYYSDELNRFDTNILPSLHEKGRWWGEAVGKKKDGSTFPQELSLSLLSDSKLICVVRNISVRKRAEREIYDKSLFLQTIIDTCPYPIFYKDNKLRYLGCNVEFERFWGISLDSILNKTAKEIFDSKTIVSKADRTDKLVLKNKSAITYEDTLVLKSGIQKTVFVKKALYLKGDGTVGGIMGIITDITALREAKVRYRLLVDSSNDGIAITNDSLHIYANDKFANIFGYSSGKDIIGKGYEYVIHANDVQRVKRYTLQRRAGKNVDNHYIVRGVKKNGDIIYIDISVSLIIYKGLPASLAFVRDVTDRIVAQKELKMAEEQYRAIFENTGTGTCIIRNDMIITLVNNKFSQISGYTKEEIEGRMTWKDFFDVSVIEFMEKYHYARRRKGGPIIAPNQYTTVFVDRWGDKKYVLLTADIIPSTTDSIASITILPDHYVPLPFKEL